MGRGSVDGAAEVEPQASLQLAVACSPDRNVQTHAGNPQQPSSPAGLIVTHMLPACGAALTCEEPSVSSSFSSFIRLQQRRQAGVHERRQDEAATATA